MGTGMGPQEPKQCTAPSRLNHKQKIQEQYRVEKADPKPVLTQRKRDKLVNPPIISPTLLPPDWKAKDASRKEMPAAAAQGKSLLQPQHLAHQLLPANDFDKMQQFSTKGVPTDCGQPWLAEVIGTALEAGPHVSALTPDGANFTWDDIKYQVIAGFASIQSKAELLKQGVPPELKIWRVAVVPQTIGANALF